jgi:radical SAM superfamily enzyme YgiQ (UPF0313 family)
MLIVPDSDPFATNKACRAGLAPILPIGLAYIAAELEKNNIAVVVEDQFASKISNEALIAKIRKEDPQLVGFSCLTASMGNVRVLVEQIRKVKKDISIILGNIHASVFGEQLIRNGVGDIVVEGEGEYKTRDVALAIRDNTPLRDIKGIIFKEGNTVYRNPPAELIPDLDGLPYPAWHLFDMSYYRRYPMLGMYGDTVIPVQASRGCPYQCFFCSQDKMYARPRYRRTRIVIDEIEYLHAKYGAGYFVFGDAFFPFSISQGYEFCEELIKRGLHKKIQWFAETRVDLVNRELLLLMKKAGLRLLMYGFEVGNQKVLDSLGKNTTLEQARNAMKYTKEAGVYCLGLFMLGMPGETKATCEETIRFAKELDCDIIKFNIAVPLPGSRFFDDYSREHKDILTEVVSVERKFTSWTDWTADSGRDIYAPEGMTGKELIRLQRKAMFSFYMRPRIILRHLLRSSFSFKDLCFGGYFLFRQKLQSLGEDLRSRFA